MPLRILRVRGLVNASVVRGFLVTGMYSTFFLGTLYLEHVRHYSALQTGAAFLPWTLTVAVLSRGHHRAAGRALRAAPRAAPPGWRPPSPDCCLFATVGPRHQLLPDDLRRLLPDRLRHRQRLHAAVDARDGRRPGRGRRARLRDHQRLPADQRCARPRRAQHARDNHTHALEAAHHSLAGSLIGGYHLAFAIGAASVVAGTLAGLALLRAPRSREPEPAVVGSEPDAPHDFMPELERQAA